MRRNKVMIASVCTMHPITVRVKIVDLLESSTFSELHMKQNCWRHEQSVRTTNSLQHVIIPLSKVTNAVEWCLQMTAI